MSQGLPNGKPAVSLLRFLSHVLDARDKAGNTALNLVARIGNRSIIQQLLEIHADPSLPNYKGVSAKDFGVGVTQQDYTLTSTIPDTAAGTQATLADSQAAGDNATIDQVEDFSQDLMSSMTEMLNQSLSEHKNVLRQKSEEIDLLNARLLEFSNLQQAELERLNADKERARLRAERRAKISNLRQHLAEKQSTSRPSALADKHTSIPTWPHDPQAAPALDLSSQDPTPNTAQRAFLATHIPSAPQLRAHIAAYAHQNSNLQQTADDLKARSSELQTMYRRVVALCTGVEESRVEEALPSLVAAVESERGVGHGGEMEVGRVRDFLRKVEPVGAVGSVVSSGMRIEM